MVDQQVRARGIDDQSILDTFLTVPPENFVPDKLKRHAYEDHPMRIGERQTISQPFIVAAMVDAALVGADDRALEIGAGSGHAAAVASRLAGVISAIERHEKLARWKQDRIEALAHDNCAKIAGDGMKDLPEKARFVAILVPASRKDIPRNSSGGSRSMASGSSRSAMMYRRS